MIDWTTLLESVGIRRPRHAPVAHRETTTFPAEQNPAHVPREYWGLYAYLERRYASAVVLTFAQIEALLGFALPTAARTERDWWMNIADPQRQSAAWIGAGRTAAPNLGAGIITFERRV